MSFKPDQARRPGSAQARPIGASGTASRGTVFDPPLGTSLPTRPSIDIHDRARERYRTRGNGAGRIRDNRPLWPETKAGWALLGGVSVLLVVVLVGILAMPGRPDQQVVVLDANGSPTASPIALATETPGSGASASPTDEPSPILPRDPTIPPTTLTGYRWPLDAPMVTLPFGPSDWGDFLYNGAKFHDGVDMASWCGDKVLAAHDGTVLAVGTKYDDYLGWVESLQPYKDLFTKKKWWNSLPLTVVIDDGDGYRTIYAHEYQITVKVGQKVKAGQLIGYEGQTGNASGCHVHFGIFTPAETAMFELDPGIVARDLLPQHELARVNPLYVLPFRCEIEEMRVLFPDKAAPCPPLPTATPKPTKK